MLNSPKYDLKGGKRRVGMRATDGPKGSLLSTFRNPTGGLEFQNTNKGGMGTSGQSSGFVSGGNDSLINFVDEEDDEEEELTSTRAPSVTGSSQGARARLPTSSLSTGVGGELEDVYCDVEDFPTPKQPKAKFLLGNLSDNDTLSTDEQQSGNIKPTVWKSKNTKGNEDEEWRKETEMMLREKEKGRMNPQHIRGAGFDTEGVKKMAKKTLLGSRWETGSIKKKPPTYKRKATFGSQSLGKSTQAKTNLDSDSDSEDENKKESKSESSNFSTAQPVVGFRDPTILYALPEKEIKEGVSPKKFAQKEFRNPLPLPPKKDTTEENSQQSKFFGFKDPTEMYKLSTDNHKFEEKEPQTRAYVDDSGDDIASFKGSEKEDSKKRKASKAIDFTSKEDWVGKDGRFSSPDDAEFSVNESQSSSQAKKRKAITNIPDLCVICNEVLPIGTLDAWRYDDGELKPIRMAEWSIICNKHKEAGFQEQWNKRGYPVINWGELKKRVERHHQILVDIVTNEVTSPFRDVLVSQQKETRGNAAMLLHKDVRLQYPGYYGPRGSSILLHEITTRLGSFIGDAAKKDRLIGQGGVSAFIQTVLVPELGVRLIMEDLNVGEPEARRILDASQDLGEKLHFNDYIEDIYDEEDGPWFDINATQTVSPVAQKKRGRLVDLCYSDLSSD
ncbi:RTC4-like domain-containing protein [Morchella snyderi]|nr:RTC4-like domain-containing protein [Morchella snyderi]